MYKVEGIDTSLLDTILNDEMVVLMEKIKQGDEKAREKMIKGNLKLVLSVIKKFNQRGERADDLFQVGTMGLIKSIDNFDASHNVKFSTYAVPMIIGEIRRYLRDNGSIKVSRSLKDIAYKTLNVRDAFLRDYHREATIEEIANIIDVEPIDVLQALEAIQDPVSIFTPIYDNGSDVIELIDQISDGEEIEQNLEKNRMIEVALKKLNQREKLIIHNRYFNDKTQMEIASELGISQAQVSRIEKNALKTMYNEIKEKNWKYIKKNIGKFNAFFII